MFLIVFLTALGVGGTTMLGAVGGYCFQGAAKRAGDGAVLSLPPASCSAPPWRV